MPDEPRAQLSMAREAGDIEPSNIFEAPALLANEMMMTLDDGVKPHRFAFQMHFPHQAGLRQRVQTVVNGGP